MAVQNINILLKHQALEFQDNEGIETLDLLRTIPKKVEREAFRNECLVRRPPQRTEY